MTFRIEYYHFLFEFVTYNPVRYRVYRTIAHVKLLRSYPPAARLSALELFVYTTVLSVPFALYKIKI